MTAARLYTVTDATSAHAVALRRAADLAPLLVIRQRELVELSAELGGYGAAEAYLLDVAEDPDKLIGLHLERGDASQTVFIAPRAWTQERLQCWVAGHHRELESESGVVVRVGTERQPLGRRR